MRRLQDRPVARPQRASARGRERAPVQRLGLPAWLTRTWRSAPLLVLCCSLLAVMGGMIFLPRLLDAFPLQKIGVEGVQDVRRQQEVQVTVAARVGGENFFSVPLHQLHEDVSALPWVADLQVQRRWPGELLLRVTERQPVAVWNEDQLVASDGQLFRALDKYDVSTLPRLTGPRSRLTEVMGYYHSMGRILQDAGLRIRSIQVDARLTARLQLDSGIELVVDREHYAAKLQRFVALYRNALERDPRTLARVDLRYADGMAITWGAPARPDRNERA